MPDKRYTKGCGKKCIRCWMNRLNHGSKLKKKQFPKAFEVNVENTNVNSKYQTLMEEFHDKYIICTYNHENMEKVNEGLFGDMKIYNDNLISSTTDAYNEWLYNEKNITKKIKSKNLIKEITTSCILANKISKTSVYYKTEDGVRLRKYGYYLFECTYKQ